MCNYCSYTVTTFQRWASSHREHERFVFDRRSAHSAVDDERQRCKAVEITACHIDFSSSSSSSSSGFFHRVVFLSFLPTLLVTYEVSSVGRRNGLRCCLRRLFSAPSILDALSLWTSCNFRQRLFTRATLCIARSLPSCGVRLSVCLSHTGIVSKRLKIS